MPEVNENQQTELAPLPGWGGMPFPPEKPRRDVDEPAEAGLPTAASVAAASAIGEEAEANFTHEDRRPLDRRRRRARSIDSLLLAPIAFGLIQLTNGVTVAAGLMVLAIDMSYFFVMESLKGQTLGKKVMKLRVVHPDGSAASASKIAARTILRPIDYSIAGIVAVLASGKKRQRLGDMLAGTIVREDNRVFKPAPESPLLVVYPVLWIGAALAAMVALQPMDPMLAARSSHPYMAKIDKICEKQVRQAKALDRAGELNLISARVLYRQQERKIAKLPNPPADVRTDVKEVLAHHRRLNVALDRMMRDIHRAPGDPTMVVEQHRPAVEGLVATANQRFAELSLPYCAAS
jgi:hypothetical protein